MEQKLGEAKGEGTRLQEKLSLVEAELQSTKTCLCRARTELADLRDSEKEQEEASKRIRDKIVRLEVRTEKDLMHTYITRNTNITWATGLVGSKPKVLG